MSRRRFTLQHLLLGSVILVLPLISLEIIKGLLGAQVFDSLWALRWVFGILLLTVSRVTRPVQVKGEPTFIWPGIISLLGGLIIGLGISVSLESVNLGGWLSLVAIVGLTEGGRRILAQRRHWMVQWLLILGSGFFAATVIVSLAQIQSEFAQEEFFAILDVFILGVFFSSISMSSDLSERIWNQLEKRKGVRLHTKGFLGGSFVFIVVWALISIRAYQRSFYSLDVPSNPGISSDNPFICDTAFQTADTSRLDGEAIFADLVDALQLNPDKKPPTLGALALMTKNHDWAEKFRVALVKEAVAGSFTEPAHSIKWGQYQASRRLYFYVKVQDAFPDLFSLEDRKLLSDWFADINRRALTVEWVDWLYALAFSKWPEGPYENQANGAGLLSLLEYHNMSAPELSNENLAYLERERRGWQARFRNTDDAYTYQSVWIENAYYQSLLDPDVSDSNMRLSFEWLLLQALPDGKQLSYNSSGSRSLAGPAYLGAELLEDPRLMWLAARALEIAKQEGKAIGAFPGTSEPVDLSGSVPEVGSCLLYSESGLPNQLGPLAPDKVVLRDGWQSDSKYVLLNLRFAGWHRYKATNTVTMMYKGGPIVKDSSKAQAYDWLPEGRSLFRDKRVPRENLNGLLVERSGIDAVVQILTGIGGQWAQDPPHYAEVLDFQTSDIMDVVHTRVEGWEGWTHDRRLRFYHEEDVIAVIDTASSLDLGPFSKHAGIAWQAVNPPIRQDETVVLASEDSEVRLLVLNAAGEVVNPSGGEAGYGLIYSGVDKGSLNLVSLFLFDEWVDATVQVSVSDSTLIVEGDTDQVLEIPISFR